MANTYVDYTATAAQTDFAFNFNYLEDSHVVVEIDGIDKTLTTDYTIVTSPSKKVVLTSGATAGQLVRVKRVSDFGTDLVNFVNGSVLNEADLDKAYQHNRYLNEEAAEGNNDSMQTVGGGTDFNANNNKIVNLATPTLSTDAVNKIYIDDRVALASSNLNGFDKSTHTGDNSNTEFTLSFTSQTTTAEAYLVTIDGVVQTPTTAYSVNTTTNKIIFTSAPPTSASIVVVPIGTTSSASDATVTQSGTSTTKTLANWTNDLQSATSTGSTTSRTLASRFADVVNVKDYGATGDGSTDDSTAIQNAINAGGNIFFPSGSYKIGSSINLASNIKLFGEKSSKIVRDDGGNRIIGKATDYTALTTTADLAKGTTVLSLDSSGYSSLSVGDYIYVTDNTSITGDFITNNFSPASSSDYHNIDQWIYMTQTFKVLEKLGSDQVRLDSAAIIFFPTTGAGGAFKINQYVENVSIEDLAFENLSGTFTSTEDAFFNVSYVFDFEVSDCTFNLNGLSGGIYKNFGACDIKNNKFIGAKNLAVFLRQACANSVIQGNSFKNQTTGDASVFLEAHNYNITVSNNNFDGARNTEGVGIISAIQMDARVHNCVIDGNNVNGYSVGVRSELGSTMNVISNNTFQNLDTSGLRFVNSTLTTIVGNKFFNTTLTPSALANQTGAIYLNGGKWCNIQNNIIVNDSNNEDFALFGTMKYSKFSNNILTNVFSVSLLASSSYNDICNNTIESVSTSSIIKITGTGDSSSVTHYNTIKGNRLYYTGGSSCTYAINVDNGSECNLIHDNEASNVDYVVGLTNSTSNAQSMKHNREQTTSATASNNIYNVAISAPVMPSFAVMPRRFEIYSTSTGFNNNEQNGEHAWQYVNESGGLNYFRKLSLTNALVSI
ncbi:MAG: hypothetical protein CL816_08955 [Coxiellaceae bacterium]|nr:hypothetical protein [Coxiellaceae bacterium]|tara:strand:+ start:7510 stop:10179 length:2670 start_codon:yes stop_codon:yes gene_type:complete